MKERDIRGVEYTLELDKTQYSTMLNEPLSEQALHFLETIETGANTLIKEQKEDKLNLLYKLYYIIRDNNLSKKDILQTINNIYKECTDEDVE